MKRILALFALFTAAASLISAAEAYKIAVIPKGTTHEFWKSIHAGAVKAQREFEAQGVAVTIIWKGPLKEDDREQQIQVVENFIGQHVSAIVLAPRRVLRVCTTFRTDAESSCAIVTVPAPPFDVNASFVPGSNQVESTPWPIGTL